MGAPAVFPHPCEDVTRRVHGASRAGGLFGRFARLGLAERDPAIDRKRL